MNNELIISNFANELSKGTDMFCSLDTSKEENKAILLNAMNNPDGRLSDMINTTITIKDIFCQNVPCKNQETGEIAICPRVVLIDKEGHAYSSISFGVFNSLKNILFVYGMPSEWEKPLSVKIMQLTRGNRKMLTLNLVK